MDIEWSTLIGIIKDIHAVAGLLGLAILSSIGALGYAFYRTFHIHKKVDKMHKLVVDNNSNLHKLVEDNNVNVHKLIVSNNSKYNADFAKASELERLKNDVVNVKNDTGEVKQDMRALQDKVDDGFNRMSTQMSNLQNTLLAAFSNHKN